MSRALLVLLTLLITLGATPIAWADDDPLPAWNDGAVKQRIVKFVHDVTAVGGKDFVKPEARVATFDNDGTLWTEQPIYFQFFFALARLHHMAPRHPEWKTTQPFKAALAGDMKTVLASGKKGLVSILTVTHTGMTPEQFQADVRQWLASGRHPRFKVPFTSLVYEPQLELMKYLRANDFKVYIVTGGGMDFVRTFSDPVYGVKREEVVGSSLEYAFRPSDGQLVRNPGIGFIDDGPGKPVGIQVHIGRRPILAFGNSDGDLQMLQYTAGGKGPYLDLIVHHDDAVREYAYDRKSEVGRLDKAWDAALENGWTVVSMKNDWKQIYPSPRP